MTDPLPARNVLHLIAAEPRRETDLSGLLDAALLAVRIAGGVAVCVGPWKDAHARARCLGVPLADAIPAPAGIPEFARGRLRTTWKHRPIDLVHCWGVPAASLARAAFPSVPRVFTPLEQPGAGEWHRLRQRSLRASQVVFFDPHDAKAWRAQGIEGITLPAPSTKLDLDRSRVRTSLGLESSELALLPISDVCDSARAAASMNVLSRLAVADIFITGLINIGPHTRRARSLASISPVRMRVLPSRGTLTESLSAADVVCWGPEPARPRALAASWCQRTLLATTLRSGVLAVMPQTPATNRLVNESLEPVLRTPDASSTGVAHTISRQLRCEQQRSEIRERLIGSSPEQPPLTADDLVQIYARIGDASASTPSS